MIDKPTSFASHQQGTVLILSLVILVIMTMLALTAMRTSNLQFLMAANIQEQTQALIRAENAMLAARDDINATFGVLTATGVTTTSTTGFYKYATGVGTGIDVTAISTWNTVANYRTTANGDKYIIEYLDTRPIAGGSETVGGAGSGAVGQSVYRVTVRASSTRGATRTLQSIIIITPVPE